MALSMATMDCTVLLYTTGRYCSHSSDVYPFSWMILKEEGGGGGGEDGEEGEEEEWMSEA